MECGWCMEEGKPEREGEGGRQKGEFERWERRSWGMTTERGKGWVREGEGRRKGEGKRKGGERKGKGGGR